MSGTAEAALAARPSAASRRGTSRPSRRELGALVRRYQPRLLRAGVLLSYLAVATLLYLGWRHRDQQPFTAEFGVGYWLGIVGGTMMLLLLLYPLRKKARFMRHLGPVPWWFRMHMTFGVLGPVCILFHCGFQFGSLNSNVALVCMLIVATSGLVGRYFYIKIHHGLYGSRTSLGELRQDAELLKGTLAEKVQFAPALLQRLDRFEQHALHPVPGVLNSALRYLWLGLHTWHSYFGLRRQLRQALAGTAAAQHWAPSERRRLQANLNAHLAAHLESVRKVAEFAFYERLFSLWHLFHFPLFLMLVISGLVHVAAVHLY